MRILFSLRRRRGRQVSFMALTWAATALCGLRPSRALFAQGGGDVWVNTSSGVYHCPGMPYFGRTKRGEYLREAVAIARGFRPNGGKRCFASRAGDSASQVRALPVVPRTSTEPGAPSGRTQECILRSVIDADTIECESVGRIRLIGIDAPERSQKPFGRLADSALAALAPVGSRIALESDVSAKDRYGRTLAYVWFGGRMLNWRLVREGWAKSYRYPPDLRHTATLEAAEVAARRERRGLWALDAFACEPAARRQRRC